MFTYDGDDTATKVLTIIQPNFQLTLILFQCGAHILVRGTSVMLSDFVLVLFLGCNQGQRRSTMRSTNIIPYTMSVEFS